MSNLLEELTFKEEDIGQDEKGIYQIQRKYDKGKRCI